MIDLHYWPTPNGHKVSIFLEETGTPYTIIPVNIGKGDQFKPEFLEISPNNRMPAIVDRAAADGGAPISVFESGAILVYLAAKTGRFLPRDTRAWVQVLEWLFWQVAGLGPMAGQNHHFATYATEKLPYAIDRYVNETARLYAVLDKRLTDRKFVAGEYSIADMACYPWVVPHERQRRKSRGLSESEALVRRLYPESSRGGARLREGQGHQRQANDRRGIAQDSVRADRGNC